MRMARPGRSRPFRSEGASSKQQPANQDEDQRKLA